jgi:hypothetical protein
VLLCGLALPLDVKNRRRGGSSHRKHREYQRSSGGDLNEREEGGRRSGLLVGRKEDGEAEAEQRR